MITRRGWGFGSFLPPSMGQISMITMAGAGLGEPGGVEFTFSDDHGRAGEPGAARLQGDREPAAGDGDLPGISAAPVPGVLVRGGGRGSGGRDRAGAAGAGLA